MDLVYTLAFVPGLVLALFGIYWIAGPMTLPVLPMAMFVNWIMFRIQSGMFAAQGLKVRRNAFGFVFYSLLLRRRLATRLCRGLSAGICHARQALGHQVATEPK
ncbi:hypothetical protein [Paraburkholderia mimosarum]|uniref:hypothetical protein n=1 Tax=Paraburkholderia mimosarum TaxID=312026 RepID=UPI000418F416|nr:hypothetical protein [Paraburkholderia mimosarum]